PGASVWRARQTSSGDQWAVDWQQLGKPGRGDPSSLSVVQQRPGGSLEAVVVADGSVWHVSSPQPEASAFWPAWTSLGSPGGAAAVAASTATLADNRAEVFGVG